MLNKISLRRIKLFLSLKEAKRRSNLNLNGFSLIELMVAVAILAMVIFGIFQAYSTGFMGMVDARDRTVATNYAREAMEDVKNMDFEKITTTTKSVISSNTKYRVDVNVSSESANLKKVITVVSWKDRNETDKTVEATMLVNFLEVYASEAAKIVLFADYYTILNSGGTTELTAVIKDIKGNTIIDWNEGSITFSKFSGGSLGYLSESVVTPINGIAKTTFSSNGSLTEEVGYTVIEASVTLPNGSNVSDSVTIKITDGPVKIKLESNPEIIKASTTNCPTITASLRNAADEILKIDDLVIDVEINFSVFGEGDLSTSTITILAENGNMNDAEVTIDLCPTGNPGLASVVATATNLESDKADVRFLGPPDSISISANPNPIYVDDIEGSTVTVSLLDVNGFSTSPTGVTPLIISLTLETSVGVGGDLGGGDLVDDSFSFPPSDSEGIIRTTTFFGQLDTGTARIFASGGGLPENSVTINILSSLVPDHIELSANPENVKVGPGVGEEYISTIKAIVYDSSGKIVTNYNEKIYFTSLPIGTFSDGSSSIELTPVNGVATEYLSSLIPGNATVTVSSVGLTDVTVTVGFYTGPSYIGLAFNPPEKTVKADGVETITIIATIYDVNNIIVTGYNEKIYFTSLPMGTFSYGSNSIELTPVNGVATAELSSSTPGNATVTVSSVGLTDVIEILEFYEETTLTLTEEPIQYDPTNKVVTFYINVAGDMITVDEMKVIWDNSSPSERLYKIVIDEVEVYTGSAKSGTIVDIIPPNEDLLIGTHTIELTFIHDVVGKQIDVMFYPPGEGWYLIRFDVPEAL